MIGICSFWLVILSPVVLIIVLVVRQIRAATSNDDWPGMG